MIPIYTEIHDLTKLYRYKDAEKKLDEAKELPLENRHVYLENILQVLINSYRHGLDHQYGFLRKIRHQLDKEMEVYYQLTRLDFLTRRQSMSRAIKVYGLMERIFEDYEDDAHLYMFYVDKAEFLYEKGRYEDALEILGKFTAKEYPCPLMYFELKARILMKLGLEREVNQLMRDVFSLVEGQELELEKQESLVSIRLQVALYQGEHIAAIDLARRYIEILNQFQKPYAYDHYVLTRALVQLGYSNDEVLRMIGHFEITDKSIPYLVKREQLFMRKASIAVSETDNYSEILFS